MEKAEKQGITIPKHELEALAETLYPAIREFFESEQGQAEFKAWQERQKEKRWKRKVNVLVEQQTGDNLMAIPHYTLDFHLIPSVSKDLRIVFFHFFVCMILSTTILESINSRFVFWLNASKFSFGII